MKKIRNKNQLLRYLDGLICNDKKFKMPKFSMAINNSKFFDSEYKNLIFILNKKNKDFIDNTKFDEILLSCYFSSIKVKKKIVQINQLLKNKLSQSDSERRIFKKQKNIYKDINI